MRSAAAPAVSAAVAAVAAPHGASGAAAEPAEVAAPAASAGGETCAVALSRAEAPQAPRVRPSRRIAGAQPSARPSTAPGRAGGRLVAELRVCILRTTIVLAGRSFAGCLRGLSGLARGWAPGSPTYNGPPRDRRPPTLPDPEPGG